MWWRLSRKKGLVELKTGGRGVLLRMFMTKSIKNITTSFSFLDDRAKQRSQDQKRDETVAENLVIRE
jgi:hypothetical protein